ncbi:hypothetical protein [Clostridium ganghwense]|nr:hypothetical protein [Clostridium ganghwense]
MSKAEYVKPGIEKHFRHNAILQEMQHIIVYVVAKIKNIKR